MVKSKGFFVGIIWSSLQRFGTMLISFIGNIVLARLLTPDDFGTVGMLLIFLTIANTFVDSGFGSALIQKQRPTQRDLSTVFYINLLMSAVLYLILFLSAPAISIFYHIDLLCPILRIEGILLFINALSLINVTILRKESKFKELSIANLIGTLLGTALGIYLAYKGYGVWSLVARLIACSGITTVLLWYFNKWRPSLIFSIESFKELFSFGGFILLSSIFTALGNNIQSLLIGRFFKPNILGNYTQAKQLRDISSTSISAIVGQVIYTDFANIQDDKNMQKKHLIKSISMMAFIVSPMMFFLLLIAEPLIILLYSNQWLIAVPYFQILCLGGIFLPLQDVNYYLVAANGGSKTIFFANVTQVISSIVIMLLCTTMFGMDGLLWAMVLSAFIFYVVYACLASISLQSNLSEQLVIVMKPIFLAAVTTILSYFLISRIPITGLGIIVIAFGIYAIIFIMLALLVKSHQIKELFELIKNMWK